MYVYTVVKYVLRVCLCLFCLVPMPALFSLPYANSLFVSVLEERVTVGRGDGGGGVGGHTRLSALWHRKD